MPQTAQINFKLTDNTYSNQPIALGLYGIMGEFPMGPVAEVSDVITSYNTFKKIYGDVNEKYPAVFQAKKALEGGASLRVYNIGVKKGEEAGTQPFKNVVGTGETAQNFFALQAKYDGTAYNNLKATVTNSASGRSGYFDITITLTDDNDIVIDQEVYTNLHIPTYDDVHYLDTIENNSKLVKPYYYPVTTSTTALSIAEETKTFSGALQVNGIGAYNPSAEVLSAFKDAVDAFADYNDIWGLCYPSLKPGSIDYTIEGGTPGTVTLDTTSVLLNLISKVNERKDVRGMIWVGDGQKGDMITNRELLGDSEWIDLFGGDAIFYDPLNSGAKIATSPMGAIIGVFGASDAGSYPWYSAAGVNRGKVKSALGVTYNYGVPSKFDDLNELAQNQINLLVKDNVYGVYLSGNFTGQFTETMKSFTSIMKLYIYIKRTLRSKLLPFIEEPLDLILVRKIADTVEKEMRDLNSTTKRALQQPIGYKWNGDQEANTVGELVVNDPIDFQNGKFKGILQIQPVNSLQVMDIEVALTNADVDLSI